MTCTSLTVCTACKSSYFLYPDSSCNICPVTGYYINVLNCSPCDSTCETCNGPYATNCLTCRTSDPKYLLGNTCVPCNQVGQSISGTNCITSACNAPCATCTANLNYCLTCATGQLRADNTCGSCASNQYADVINVCTNCPVGCATCLNALNCITC